MPRKPRFTLPFQGYLLALGRQIGAGSAGQVFAAANAPSNSFRYALKIQSPKSPTEKPLEFTRECYFAQRCAALGIGPELLACGEVDGGRRRLMLSERWSVNLLHCRALSMNERYFARCRLQILIERMHSELRLLHLDLVPRNVLLKFDLRHRLIDVCLTDFGHAEELEEAGDPADCLTLEMYENYAEELCPCGRNPTVVRFIELVKSGDCEQLDALVRRDLRFVDRLLLHSRQLCKCRRF